MPNMRQYAPYPTELEQAVRELHGEVLCEDWKFDLKDIDRDFGNAFDRSIPIAGGLTFIILVPCHDSYHPELYRPVQHYHPVPAATYNRQSWERWLFDRILDTLTHEAGECIMFRLRDEFTLRDGSKSTTHDTRPFAPLHGPGDNPYVVHSMATLGQRSTSYLGEINPEIRE